MWGKTPDDVLYLDQISGASPRQLLISGLKIARVCTSHRRSQYSALFLIRCRILDVQTFVRKNLFKFIAPIHPTLAIWKCARVILSVSDLLARKAQIHALVILGLREDGGMTDD